LTLISSPFIDSIGVPFSSIPLNELELEIDERYSNAPASAMDAVTDDAI
jgi:hypothetical protein